MEKKRGVYVVLEGVPKCGKTTQIIELHKALKERFPQEKILLTREPGGDDVAEKIREIVLSPAYRDQMTAECNAYLFAGSRAQTLRTMVRPVVEKGGIVLADRSVDSSRAIQGWAERVGIDVVDDINRVAVSVITPDKRIFIDASPAVCQFRSRKERDKNDKFELKPLWFYEKIREGYMQLSGMEIIPGDGSIEAVHGLILISVLQLLNERGFN